MQPLRAVLTLTLGSSLAFTALPARAQDESPAYGAQGSSHVGLSLGFGSGTGGSRYGAGLDYGYFVLDGVAPGVEAQVTGGSNVLTTGLTLATLRLVPVRTSSFVLFLVGRAGRVMLSDHVDGWGAGGGIGGIYFAGGRVGLQLAYDVLALMPESFCDDLSAGCQLRGLSAGIVAAF